MTTKKQDCIRCGLCCLDAGGDLSAEPADIKRWKKQGRLDILERCFEPEPVTGIIDLWMDFRTSDDALWCPWLRKRRGRRFSCAINYTKPIVCKKFVCDLQNIRDDFAIESKEMGLKEARDLFDNNYHLKIK